MVHEAEHVEKASEAIGGEIVGYSGSELTAYGGRKRRKGSKQRKGSRKGSRKGTRKGSRKHKGGSNEELVGGKRSRSKKTTKGKRSAWITHVLNFAKDNGMKYPEALKDKRCRATYKKM